LHSDAKLIVGFTAFAFAAIHLTILACLSVSPAGETTGWMALILEYPIFALWPGSTSGNSLAQHLYFWVGGTLMYAAAGAVTGLVIHGIRRIVINANAHR